MAFPLLMLAAILLICGLISIVAAAALWKRERQFIPTLLLGTFTLALAGLIFLSASPWLLAIAMAGAAVATIFSVRRTPAAKEHR